MIMGVFNGCILIKNEFSSSTLDFYSFMSVRRLMSKEGRDAATVELPGFFLQTHRKDKDLILLKLAEAVVLLLADLDQAKWKKYSRRENGNR